MLNGDSRAIERTCRGGKIIFNSGRSVIDCLVRELSASRASAIVESTVGVPSEFKLLLSGEGLARQCALSSQTGNLIEIAFESSRTTAPRHTLSSEDRERSQGLMRGQMLALRSSLDEVDFGVVLLDTELRAVFINKAFRRMWRLPDAKADSKPAFVALMYHGRDTNAYQLPPESLSSYIADRVARIKTGNPDPLDLRLSNGEVLRMQCAVLPNGGRMLSYTPVTDIVRNSDELMILQAALYRLQEGVILLDSNLRAQFMNESIRSLWKISAEQADGKPHYSELVGDARHTGAYGVAAEELDSFIAQRIALVRAGDSRPQDLRTGDGRYIRSQCTILPSGGRMLTYCDITDLILAAEKLEELATTDSMTGLFNRRHFMAMAETEWTRYQRYRRPLSLLTVDVDSFKLINDRFGHAAGDAALSRIGNVCRAGKRQSDILARLGGDEFAMLLPETDGMQAGFVAERIRSDVASSLEQQAVPCAFTVSVGVATADPSMLGVAAFFKASDMALYEAKSAGRNAVGFFRGASVQST